MASVSRMATGSGDGTTRRYPRLESRLTTHPRSAAIVSACSSVRNGPMNLVGLSKAGSSGLTATWVTIATAPRIHEPSATRRRARQMRLPS